MNLDCPRRDSVQSGLHMEEAAPVQRRRRGAGLLTPRRLSK